MVDEELRVYGVRGLRVVDSSVVLLIFGATTQGTVYAIAEKARLFLILFERGFLRLRPN